MLRYAFKFQAYNFEIKYIKGKDNIADGLYRAINRVMENKGIKTEQDKLFEKVREAHMILGHGSICEMKYFLRGYKNWKEIFKMIKNYVEGCIICKEGSEQKRPTKYIAQESTKKYEKWQCYLIGPIRGKDGTNKHIMVAQENYSKYVECSICNTKKAEEIIRILEKNNKTPWNTEKFTD